MQKSQLSRPLLQISETLLVVSHKTSLLQFVKVLTKLLNMIFYDVPFSEVLVGKDIMDAILNVSYLIF